MDSKDETIDGLRQKVKKLTDVETSLTKQIETLEGVAEREAQLKGKVTAMETEIANNGNEIALLTVQIKAKAGTGGEIGEKVAGLEEENKGLKQDIVNLKQTADNNEARLKQENDELKQQGEQGEDELKKANDKITRIRAEVEGSITEAKNRNKELNNKVEALRNRAKEVEGKISRYIEERERFKATIDEATIGGLEQGIEGLKEERDRLTGQLIKTKCPYRYL
ncbi:Chromosome partition protein Smc [subsurface metagenome]